MKRVGNIYPKIIDKNNLLLAIKKASKGKNKRRNVQNVMKHLNQSVDYLHKILENCEFVPTRGEIMTIHDGVRKKERVIEKPRFFPDQCVHWALMLQINQIFQKVFIDQTCASIPNRGVHYMKRKIENALVRDRKFTKYALVMDIKKFYESINITILKSLFRKVIKDNKTLKLMDAIADCSHKGLPIGNFTSQWFANFYLYQFDHWVKEVQKIKYYYRYMDDMIFFSNNKKKLHRFKDDAERYLNALDLKIKPNWQVFKVDSRPISFCGFVYHRGYTTMKSPNALRIRRRIKKVSRKKYLSSKDASAVISFLGQMRHTDSYMFYHKNIKNKINIKKCKEVIRNESRKQCKTF